MLLLLGNIELGNIVRVITRHLRSKRQKTSKIPLDKVESAECRVCEEDDEAYDITFAG